MSITIKNLQYFVIGIPAMMVGTTIGYVIGAQIGGNFPPPTFFEYGKLAGYEGAGLLGGMLGSISVSFLLMYVRWPEQKHLAFAIRLWFSASVFALLAQHVIAIKQPSGSLLVVFIPLTIQSITMLIEKRKKPLPFSKTFQYNTHDKNNVVINIYPTVSRGIRILQWLYDEEVGDISIGPRNTNLEKGFQRRTRFLARMTSFVVIFCTIDQVLKKELGGCRPKNSDVFERWKTLRDKIFAHTSYGDPRKDSASLQLTSLAYLSGQLFNGSSNRYTIGGGSYQKSLNDTVVGVIDAANLPECGIVKDYEAIMKYFEEWETNIETDGFFQQFSI